MTNPIIENWDTPFGIPPFTKIKPEHFESAFEDGFLQARDNYQRISKNEQAPSFENTIVAMELAQSLLDRIAALFFNLVSAHSSSELQALERKIAPQFAIFNNELAGDRALFERVQTLYEASENVEFSTEQKELLERYYKMFVRSGAKLSEADKERLGQIMERLAELGTVFSQNVLADEASWTMEVEEADIQDLPLSLQSAMRAAAEERESKGAIVTLSRSLIGPFLQYCSNRQLREKAFNAWIARGAGAGDNDNRPVLREILALRDERAHLLGYDSFAEFKLETEMAKDPSHVRNLLSEVWEAARPFAESDALALEDLLLQDGINDRLRPYDWRYYSERRRRVEYDLDEDEVKAYFQLENMIEAAFYTATELFGIDFHPVDAPRYHEDLRIWDVQRSGKTIGVFIGDYFNRVSKRSGAWCSSFRKQNGLTHETPITVNVCNFAKAPKGQPCLLTLDDARTLFHEFGHALHNLLSNVTYPSLAGTSVARDFVELPSQLFEHWLMTPEILQRFAVHFKTGEPMPEALITKIKTTQNYDMGFQTAEYIASALVDLDFHTLPAPDDPIAVQQATLDRMGLPESITMRHAAPHFLHIFAGDGYSSGYYSYMWSEVMDSDAFFAFEEAGNVFDKELAKKLHDYVYSAGAKQKPEELYQAFRGAMPQTEALLRSRGFL